MKVNEQLAKQFRDMHFGGNLTGSNLKDTLSGISWQQATTTVYSFNTIALLVFHINYYVCAVLQVLEGEPLQAHDKYSFNSTPVLSQEDWEKLLNKVWADAEKFAALTEQMPESRLWENLADEKYGNYYRNIHGIIEHAYYHMGQIMLIKKILQQQEKLTGH